LLDFFVGVENLGAAVMVDHRKTRIYRVSFRREGRDIESIYWAGSLDETRELAEQIAFKCGAEVLQLTDLTDSEANGWSGRMRQFDTVARPMITPHAPA
jgi:hypothetical protein